MSWFKVYHLPVSKKNREVSLVARIFFSDINKISVNKSQLCRSMLLLSFFLVLSAKKMISCWVSISCKTNLLKKARKSYLELNHYHLISDMGLLKPLCKSGRKFIYVLLVNFWPYHVSYANQKMNTETYKRGIFGFRRPK